MIYVLYGENETELNKFIDSLQKENNIEDKVTYNYKDSSIDDVLEEASYSDLFGTKKLIVLNDSDFLTSKSTLEHKGLDNYINSPNPNTILIFKIIIDKLDERKKLVKTLKEKSKVIEFKIPDEKNIDAYIKEYYKNLEYKITNEAINEIKNRLKANPKVLDTELNKLALYKYEDKNITIIDVIKVITKYEENNIFKLVDAVIKKDKSTIFTLYKELIENKEEPTVILVLLANQFRLMYQANVLASSGLDKYKIGTFLKEHHYRVGLALDNSKNIEQDELIKYLKRLAEIDIEIKTGLTDKTKALETFFLEL